MNQVRPRPKREWREIGRWDGEAVHALYEDGRPISIVGNAVTTADKVAIRVSARRAIKDATLQITLDEQALERTLSALDGLPARLKKKLARGSMRKWANRVLGAVKAATPIAPRPYLRYPNSAGPRRAAVVHIERPGGLRRAMRVKVKTYRNAVIVLVGPRATKGSYSHAGWRVQFSETDTRNKKRGTVHVGKRMLASAAAVYGATLLPQVISDVNEAIKEAKL